MIHFFSFLCPHPPISCYRWLALHKSASAGDLFLLNGSSSSHCHQLLFKVDWLTDLILLPESNSYELLLQKQNWIGRFLKATIRKTALCLQVWKEIVWNTVYLPSECATKRASIILHVREQLFHGFIIRARNTRQLWRGSTCWTSQYKCVQRVYSRLFSSS